MKLIRKIEIKFAFFGVEDCNPKKIQSIAGPTNVPSTVPFNYGQYPRSTYPDNFLNSHCSSEIFRNQRYRREKAECHRTKKALKAPRFRRAQCSIYIQNGRMPISWLVTQHVTRNWLAKRQKSQPCAVDTVNCSLLADGMGLRVETILKIMIECCVIKSVNMCYVQLYSQVSAS